MRTVPAWSVLGWTAVGFLLSFGLVAGFSIGLFAWPLLILLWPAMLWLDRRSRVPGQARWAGLCGLGLCAALIFAINPGWWPCAALAAVTIPLGLWAAVRPVPAGRRPSGR